MWWGMMWLRGGREVSGKCLGGGDRGDVGVDRGAIGR